MREAQKAQPESFPLGKASHSFGLLRAQGGFSLIEVLVVATVLVILITTIYIGAIYAEKQVRHNYRHRTASLIASGEIEKQYALFMKEKIFRPYTSRAVVIDETDEGELKGNVSVQTGRDVEFYVTKQYPYYYVISEVSWQDPETDKRHSVKVREDFYDVEGN